MRTTVGSGILAVSVFSVLAGPAFPSGEFVYPCNGTVTTTWGTRRSYEIHNALDIANGYGTPVVAARGGGVSFRGWSGGYGNFVIVSHDGGYDTRYGHNQSFGAGGGVGTGEVIAYMGSTGHSTGPHCHFEIRRWGTSIYIPGGYHASISRGRGIPYTYADLDPVGETGEDDGPPPPPPAVLRKIAAVGNADGRQELFFIHTDDVLYHQWQLAPNGPWSGVYPLPGSPKAKTFSVARTPDGRLMIFYIHTGDDVIYHQWQTAPGGVVPGSFGGGWSGIYAVSDRPAAKQVEAAVNADGRIEIFYNHTGDDVLYHQWYMPDGRWSGIYPLPGSPAVKQLAVGRTPDGRLIVFYIHTGDDVIYHQWQTAPGGIVPGSFGGGWSGIYAIPDRPAAKQVQVAANADGRLELFYVHTGDDVLYHQWYLADGRWSGIYPLPGAAKVKRFSTVMHADGRLELFFTHTDDNLYHQWQTAPGGVVPGSFGGGWSGIYGMPGQARELTSGRNADGRVEIFYIGFNDFRYHNYWTGSGWSGELIF